MLITNLDKPLYLNSSDITYSSDMHDATRRIGKHVSTNTIRVKGKIYNAVYYKGKMIATYSKGNVDWVRTVLDNEKVAIPECLATY